MIGYLYLKLRILSVLHLTRASVGSNHELTCYWTKYLSLVTRGGEEG